MTKVAIHVVAHDKLTTSDRTEPRRLFDDEYQADCGEWGPDPP
ncbi:hypothetical protein GCM10009720_27610 [Yaniella flava]|uniref:Uncharacterized protein n=1 Tax=Yaniella flava TaxID=287930 RepID=A0ABP5GHJ1_9MICC